MGPEAERIDIEGAALKADPGLLAAEAASLSLFGGARHIRVTNVGDESLDAFDLLLKAETAGNPVVAIGPGLKTTSKLLKLALAAPAALSFACYIPDGAEAERLASAIAAEHGLRTTGQAASRLVAATGGDRAIITREIEKLALFLDAAPDRPGTLDDAALDAIGADLGDGEISGAIEAVVAGDTALLGAELAKLEEAGVSPIPLLRGLVRRLMAIAEMRGEVDAGASAADVIERHRVFFKEKAATARALRSWSPRRLAQSIEHLRQAERATIAPGTAGAVMAAAACLAVARGARRAG
jgi:DNA polymerase-3 subunit delta